MSNVLITGISGFIGSNLARALLAEGASVRGIDNLSTGKAANLEGIAGQIDFREADILDRAAMESACRGVELVFHLAAIPSVPKSIADPMGTNGPNLTGTLSVLEAARKTGVRRVIYASSSAAYGDQAPEQAKQETMPPDPISPYAVQKVAGEYYMASYRRIYGLETVSLRYFNIFGPRQDPTSQYSGVLARFITQMLRGETPTIFGDGTTSRDFTHIDNVVLANLLAAKSGQAAGRTFNVATGRSVSLLAAFEEIQRITGYRGSVKMAPERGGDIKHSIADISLAREALRYEVVTDFRSGLEKTIGWYGEQTGTPK